MTTTTRYLLDDEGVKMLAKELRDPNRTETVLVATLVNATGLPYVPKDQVVDLCVGLKVRLAFIDDRDATFTFNEELRGELRVFNGALRLYPPQVTEGFGRSLLAKVYPAATPDEVLGKIAGELRLLGILTGPPRDVESRAHELKMRRKRQRPDPTFDDRLKDLETRQRSVVAQFTEILDRLSSLEDAMNADPEFEALEKRVAQLERTRYSLIKLDDEEDA